MAEASTAQTKVCSKCGEEKAVSEFSPYKKGGEKLRPNCKNCAREINKAWRIANPERAKVLADRSRERNIEAIRERDRKRARAQSEARREAKAQWFQKHKDRLMERKAEREKARRHANPVYRIGHNMRKAIWRCAIGRGTSARIKALGYTSDDLRSHLEKQFYSLMTWDNYGTYWHVDHIRPIASFDLSDPEQFRQCWGLTNLRPLKAVENMRKNASRAYLI